jgi:hypothetical protein
MIRKGMYSDHQKLQLLDNHISFSHLNMTDNGMRLVSESNNPFVGLMEEEEEDSDNGYEQIVNFLCEYWQQFHTMLT